MTDESNIRFPAKESGVSDQTEGAEVLQHLLAEAHRQLTENTTHQTLLVTRALVLVGAAGASLGWQGAAETVWGQVAILVAIAAATLGLAALWLWKSPSPVLTRGLVEVFVGASRSAVLRRIVDDLADTVVQRVSDARRKARFITLGFLSVAISWLLMAIDVLSTH